MYKRKSIWILCLIIAIGLTLSYGNTSVLGLKGGKTNKKITYKSKKPKVVLTNKKIKLSINDGQGKLKNINFNYIWVISSNLAMNTKTINNKTIKVLDSKNKEFKNVSIKLQKNLKTINITPLSKGYIEGEKYTLIVSKSIQGLKKEKLSNDFKKQFIINKLNLLQIKVNGKYGFIDYNGKVIIKPQFIQTSDFNQGAAVALSGNNLGIINKSGIFINSMKYQSIYPESEGLIRVKFNNKVGFINNDQKVLIGFKYDDATDFKSGTAAVSKNGKWGIIDKQGKIILEPKYQFISSFVSGTARFEESGKWGLINNKGKIILKQQYDKTYDFDKGIACGLLGKQLDYFDVNGNVYDKVLFDDSGFIKVMKNNKWGVIEDNGKVRVAVKYDDIGKVDSQYMAVCLNNRWGLIDDKNNIVMKIEYRNIGILSEGICAISTNGQWGYVDKKGNIILPPCLWDCREFSNGMAAIYKNDKWGFMNKDGNFVINFKYEDVKDFNNGVAAVKLNKKWGLINTKGDSIINPKYDEIVYLNKDLIKIKLNNKWGIATNKGNIILSSEYDDIERHNSLYKIISNKSYGYINTTGKFIWKPTK